VKGRVLDKRARILGVSLLDSTIRPSLRVGFTATTLFRERNADADSSADDNCADDRNDRSKNLHQQRKRMRHSLGGKHQNTHNPLAFARLLRIRRVPR